MTIHTIIAAELARTRVGWTCPDITDETSFEQDLLCDCIDIACISLEIEDAMGVELPGAGIEACSTVGDMARLVERVRGRVVA